MPSRLRSLIDIGDIQPAGQRVDGIVLGHVDVQRRDRDIVLGNRVEVGAGFIVVDGPRRPEPEHIVTVVIRFADQITGLMPTAEPRRRLLS